MNRNQGKFWIKKFIKEYDNLYNGLVLEKGHKGEPFIISVEDDILFTGSNYKAYFFAPEFAGESWEAVIDIEKRNPEHAALGTEPPPTDVFRSAITKLAGLLGIELDSWFT